MKTSTTASNPILQAVRADIESMRTRGAGEIGKQAVRALAQAAGSYDGADLKAFQEDLLEAARLLAAARPTAVSLRNGLNRVLGPALATPDVAAARKAATSAAEAFATSIDAARAKIADLALPEFDRGETILTHCHSTAAVAVLVRLAAANKAPRVFATETRPFRQGLITSRALAERGVDVTLIVDSAAYAVMKDQDVTKVVLGADAVGADGSLYNKIGTGAVCLAAKVLDIPVLVAAESYKFSPYTLAGELVVIEERDAAEVARPEELHPKVKIHNPVFDRTPPELVRTYVTEEGLVAPKDARAFIERVFAGVKPWV